MTWWLALFVLSGIFLPPAAPYAVLGLVINLVWEGAGIDTGWWQQIVALLLVLSIPFAAYLAFYLLDAFIKGRGASHLRLGPAASILVFSIACADPHLFNYLSLGGACLKSNPAAGLSIVIAILIAAAMAGSMAAAAMQLSALAFEVPFQWVSSIGPAPGDGGFQAQRLLIILALAVLGFGLTMGLFDFFLGPDKWSAICY